MEIVRNTLGFAFLLTLLASPLIYERIFGPCDSGAAFAIGIFVGASLQAVNWFQDKSN